MNQETTKNEPLYVLYHADCSDGFCAAWAAWTVFGNHAVYLPVRHSAPAPEVPDKATVYIVDFCYPMEILSAMAQRMTKVIVIDHHISAWNAYQTFINTTSMPSTLECHFDMSRSGCALTWLHFYPDQEMPTLLQHVEDRDLWKKALAGTEEISLAFYLQMPTLTFERLQTLSLKNLHREGSVLLKQQRQSVRKLMTNRHEVMLQGQKGLAVNAPPQFSSDLGQALAQASGTFGLTYYYRADRSAWECSLRCLEGFDVGSLAVSLGGGGHTRAAGFSLPQASIIKLINGQSLT